MHTHGIKIPTATIEEIIAAFEVKFKGGSENVSEIHKAIITINEDDIRLFNMYQKLTERQKGEVDAFVKSLLIEKK